VNILTTGGNGLLGKGLIETKPNNINVDIINLKNTTTSNLEYKHFFLDVRDKRAVQDHFKNNRYDAVIHAASISNVDYVENNYIESIETNLLGTLNIALETKKQKIPFIFISSNAVYDGSSAPYDETDLLKPINKYGEIKKQCEEIIKNINSDLLTIVRPILMYGWNYPNSRSNPVTWVIEKLSKLERINVVDDVFENALYNKQCGIAIWKIILNQAYGTFNIAGADTYSRYEMALMTAKVFNLDYSLIHKVNSAYFKNIAPRPFNTSFNTNKMKNVLDVTPITLLEGLKDMKKYNNVD
jgi:dTDP-4-dehydrorhamnose reductase